MKTIATAAEYAAGLRLLADMVEANPDISADYLGDGIFTWFANGPEQFAAIARAAVRAGGTVEKVKGSGGINLDVRFGAIRAVALGVGMCERVVTGTRTVTEMVPDPDAPAPPMVERTRTEEIVEWRRPESILAGGAA